MNFWVRVTRTDLGFIELEMVESLEEAVRTAGLAAEVLGEWERLVAMVELARERGLGDF